MDEEQEDSAAYVRVPKQEYEDMRRDLFFLQCLEENGVDNWGGYFYAIEDFTAEPC